MLGKPKYQYGEKVKFEFEKGVFKEGTIEIIDSHGTFFQSDDVSYDIFVGEGKDKCLYKHIPEPLVSKIN